jgi:hypothetical protein
MTKTLIGWSLLVTIFVFGAIMPLVLITLVGSGVGAAMLRGSVTLHQGGVRTDR